ncbi:MAG: RagB/SusD family nutrient uptake outer membrane protein [Parabacteroides sp.]|nr:RagB/SusD family nutrient uptake outer membrane protein [Parabacteroides sp.]
MKKKIYILLLISGIFGFTSCNLDEVPYGFYSEDNFYKSAEDAKAAINYAYSTLTYLEYSRALVFLGDMPTGIMTTKSDASTDNQALDQWKTDNFDTNGTLMSFFKYSYIAINRANAVIKKLPDTDMPDDLRNRYMGEAYFLRAYNYYYLSCNFGLVPIHKGVVETLEQTSAPLARDMDELYDMIFEDLKTAEELMPVYSTPTMGRVDKVAAQALLAKAYITAASGKEKNVLLFKDMNKDVNTLYEEAKKYAARVMGLDPAYPQNTYGFETDLLKIYDIDNVNGKENIFLMSMDRTGENEGQYSKISKMYIPYVDGATIWLKQGDSNEFIKSHDGWGEYRTEAAFYNSYENNDKRQTHLIADKIYNEDGTLKAEWKPAGGSLAYPFCRKFIDPKFDGDKTSTRPYLIRYSDIALIYAEASGATPEAYSAIDFIRNRAGLSPLAPGLSTPEFREAVYKERKFELAFEGAYLYDLRRLNRIKDIQEVKNKGLNESQSTFYPIPQAEINLNPSLR